MRSNCWITICLFIVAVASCSLQASTLHNGIEERTKLADSRRSLNEFWQEFQTALKANDTAKIARLTKFPLDVGLSDIKEFEGIENREGFVQHFKTPFPK